LFAKKHHQLAVEHVALGQQIKHCLKTSKRCVWWPFREISRPRMVSAAARKPSNLRSPSNKQPLRNNSSTPSKRCIRSPLREIKTAANGVGRGPESVELGLKHPIGMVERLRAPGRDLSTSACRIRNRHRTGFQGVKMSPNKCERDWLRADYT